jgi:small ligand-binding sensory domain FIST
MLWAASHSVLEDPAAAVAQAVARVRATLGEGPVDLAMAFFTRPLAVEPESLAESLRSALRPGCLIGCSAGSVIATDREIEGGAALSLIAARLPGVEIKPFLLVGANWGAAMEDALEFARHTPGVAGSELVVLLGDPFSLDMERVLHAFNRHAPGLRVVGGMASAGTRPNVNVLILNDWVAHEGGVAVALRGALRADVVVSQGCRPVGPALEVTRVEQNVIFELDGQPALERAEQVLRGLPDAEREHLRQGLYVGRPAKGGASGRGDYLIRNLLGADRDNGAIAVGDRIAERERLRLHVRDAHTAREDLEMLLSPQVVDSKAKAALLFSCNGRGRAFFGHPHRDVTALQQALGGGVPVAGLFCAGEIGPVAERNYVHGHTASIAILRPR